jgi:hypothetical protein
MSATNSPKIGVLSNKIQLMKQVTQEHRKYQQKQDQHTFVDSSTVPQQQCSRVWSRTNVTLFWSIILLVVGVAAFTVLHRNSIPVDKVLNSYGNNAHNERNKSIASSESLNLTENMIEMIHIPPNISDDMIEMIYSASISGYQIY